MDKSLFIKEGKVSHDGSEGDVELPFYGDRPTKVICVTINSTKYYFTDEREAHDVIQASKVESVYFLLVEK